MKSFALAAAVAALAVTAGRAGAADADNRDVANRLVATFVEAENTMNASLFDRIFPENYIQHNPGVPPGRSGVKKLFEAEFAQIRKEHIWAHTVVEDLLVQGDRVMLRQLTTIRKGNKTYEVREIDEWRIANGMLAEHWDSDSEPHAVSTPN